MTAPIALLLPGLIAVFNRLDRGEDGIPRWMFYGTLALVFFLLTLDPLGALFYTLFVVGYAMLPWQAEYSIVTGRPPGRDDNRWFNWMQVWAYRVVGMPPVVYPDPSPAETAYYKRFGIVYGQIRGLWMIPGAILLAWHQHSYIPLSGIAIALTYPWVMVVACAAREHWKLEEGTAVVIEQIIMGYLIGTYLLACVGY